MAGGRAAMSGACATCGDVLTEVLFGKDPIWVAVSTVDLADFIASPFRCRYCIEALTVQVAAAARPLIAYVLLTMYAESAA
jgi:hypothetical protein